MSETKTFDDLWVSVSTTETTIKYTAKPGVAWSDLEAWLKNEWREKHWRWRKFGDVVVVWKDPSDSDSEEDEEDE